MKLRIVVVSSAVVGSAAVLANVVGLVAAGDVRTWSVNLGWTLGGLVGLSGALAAAFSVGRSRVGWAWRLWAAAIGLWFVGILVVDALSALGVPFGFYAEVVWTLAAAVSIAGLALRSAPGWLSFRLFVLDSLPVAFLVAGVALTLAGMPLLPGVLRLVALVVFALLPMISIQITIWLASRAINMYLVSGGLSLAAVAGIFWTTQAQGNALPQGHWSSGLLTLAFLLVAVAGFRRAAEPSSYTVLLPLEREHALRSVPGAAALIGLIVATGTAGGRFLALALAAAGAFALRSYLVRQTNVASQKELACLLELTQTLNQNLCEIDRQKDSFIASISHELRTPLTSILGYTELLGDAAADLSGEQQHFLAVVDRNAGRLLRLVNDLLLVAQIDAGAALEIERNNVDLRALAVQAVESAGPAASMEDIELRFFAEQPVVIEGDEVRLAQVIDNLLSNATKFTPDGGQVTLRLSSSGGSARLEVADTGMGMTPDEQTRLFERFYRTESATHSAISGSGLGLAISQAIAHAHGGKITVESETGIGSTFTLAIPHKAGPQRPDDTIRTPSAASSA